MGDEGMLSLAEVEFEFGQLLLDVASGEVQEGENFRRYQQILEYFSVVAESLTIARKTRR
jgi:hypothetical protein